MSAVLHDLMIFLANPIIVAGLSLLVLFLIARVVIPQETLRAWRQGPGFRVMNLVTSNYLVPVLGIILVSAGAIYTGIFGLKTEFYLGHERTRYQGKLNIEGGQAFLLPYPNQGLPGSILMMMRDIPPGGTPNERINSAPSYFTLTLQKVSGDPIEVTASVAPFGSVQVLVVDR